MCFTSLERAQVILELLAKSSPDTYVPALKNLRSFSRVPVILEKEGIEAIVTSLPTDEVKLLKELRNHLFSMQLGNVSPGTHGQISSLLKLLP